MATERQKPTDGHGIDEGVYGNLLWSVEYAMRHHVEDMFRIVITDENLDVKEVGRGYTLIDPATGDKIEVTIRKAT